MAKIRAIIKRPEEPYGHMCNISTTLENLQKIVEGYIELVTIRPGLLIICNEEGKIKGLEPNIRIPGDVICGTIIVIGATGEELSDIPIEFAEWKQMLMSGKYLMGV